MKIVLVFPPFYLGSMYNLPPLGLINLATALKGSPHEIVLIDFVLSIRQQKLEMGKRIYDDCAAEILKEQPDIVGFSAQCTTYPAVIQICKRIREKRRNLRIVMGGHNASFVDHMTLARYPFVDAIVRGEGEITFRELVGSYESGGKGESVAGVTYRLGNDIIRNEDRQMIPHLDALPLPDYRFLPPFSEYRDACNLSRSIAILEVGRGCPHQCIYCSESILWQRKTRSFSVARLVDEMENLYTNFGAECFLLSYDQFTTRRRFVISFCRRVIEKGLNHLPWYCISRLDSVDKELLALMREAGCESMCYGIDSGSKRTLAFIRKNIDESLLYDRVRETAAQGIIPTLSFVVGFPEEERQDIDETLQMALRTGIVGNNNPLIQMPTVLPGTELHNRYADRLVREVDTYFALGLEYDEGRRLGSDEDLINSEPRLFSSFYNVPCAGLPLEELNLIASYFPLMVRFYPRTFLLLSMECRASVSGLFIRWLQWLTDKLGRASVFLTPTDCYDHFRYFFHDILEARGTLTRKHLPDILRYENASLEAGKFSSEKSDFCIDIERIKTFRPKRSKKIIVEEFDFDLPVVIMDLVGGNFDKQYPRQSSVLVFRQSDDVLDITQINAFTRDLLALCNGDRSLDDICKKLHRRYQKDIDFAHFFDSCAEAIKILGEERLLEAG